MVMTRIAVAGTGGLAFYIATYLERMTSHPFILISREPNTELTEKGFRVQIVDFDDVLSLRFALTGITIVISTIPSSTTQINLINAALDVGVRRFAPAEFEGLPSNRAAQPSSPDPLLDRGKSAVHAHLRAHADRIESTSFVCGILYENFAPHGPYISSRIGHSAALSGEGNFLLNLRTMQAVVPSSGSTAAAYEELTLCLTAGQDVGKLVVKALDMPSWPAELTMVGERLTVPQLLSAAQRARGIPFARDSVQWYDGARLQRELVEALATSDTKRQAILVHLRAAHEGRYDYGSATLNAAFPEVQILRFTQWVELAWEGR